MSRANFTLAEPEHSETPVVVEVPHAGLEVPPHLLTRLVAPAYTLARDADLFVDRLYADAPSQGATLLVAHVSRLAIDLNRGEMDVDDETLEGGPAHPRAPRGLVWRMASDGSRVITRPLTRAELDTRLGEIYRPYHHALRQTIDRKVEKFGYAVVLAAHSMPSTSRPGEDGARSGVPRADVVPGSRGRTSASASLIDAVDAHARAQGWTVAPDEPYRGGFTTQHYGRPQDRVHAVQVELARRLYMDEGTLLPDPARFVQVRAWCRDLVAKLGRTTVS
jgi:N-formylglutamate amidohydrolase